MWQHKNYIFPWYTRLALDSVIPLPSIPSAGIKDLCCHTQLRLLARHYFKNPCKGLSESKGDLVGVSPLNPSPRSSGNPEEEETNSVWGSEEITRIAKSSKATKKAHMISQRLNQQA